MLLDANKTLVILLTLSPICGSDPYLINILKKIGVVTAGETSETRAPIIKADALFKRVQDKRPTIVASQKNGKNDNAIVKYTDGRRFGILILIPALTNKTVKDKLFKRLVNFVGNSGSKHNRMDIPHKS